MSLRVRSRIASTNFARSGASRSRTTVISTAGSISTWRYSRSLSTSFRCTRCSPNSSTSKVPSLRRLWRPISPSPATGYTGGLPGRSVSCFSGTVPSTMRPGPSRQSSIICR